MASSLKSAEFLTRSRIADAESGDVDALYELGVSYSTGRGGTSVDKVIQQMERLSPVAARLA